MAENVCRYDLRVASFFFFFDIVLHTNSGRKWHIEASVEGLFG